MFRINFYSSFEAHRKSAFKKRRRTHIGGILVLTTTVVFGTQILSGLLVKDQVNVLRRGLPVLQEWVDNDISVAGELDVARQLVAIRSGRLDWAPKLVAVSEALDVGLVLEKINGNAAVNGIGSHMTIYGRARSANTTLGAISGYTDTLRDDPRITVDFPVATLENIHSGGGDFEISCQPRKEKQ